FFFINDKKESNFVIEEKEYSDFKYIVKIETSDENFDISNPIHFKNGIYYLKEKGWSSGRTYDIPNRNFIFEKYDFQNKNLLDIFGKTKIPFNIATTLFNSILYRFRYLNKENYKNYKIESALDFRNNKVMSIQNKMEFIDRVLENIRFQTIGNYKLEVIYFLKNETIENIFKYKNITHFIIEEWILKYQETKGNNSFYFNTRRSNEDEEKKWKKEDVYDANDEVNYYIDQENKYFKKHLLDYIESINDISRKFDLISIIDGFRNKSERKKILKKIFNLDTLFSWVKLDHHYMQALFNRTDLPEIIHNSKNILEILFEHIKDKNNIEEMIGFYNKYNNFFYETKKTEKYLITNSKEFLQKTPDSRLYRFYFKNNIVSEKEYQEYLIDKTISKKHTNNIVNIKDYDNLIKKINDPVLEWKIRWKYWKNYEGKDNIDYFNQNNHIFDFLKDNYITLLSSNTVIKNIVKEPFFSTEKEDTKQVEFVEEMITHFESVELWNIIQEIALG
ncbi:MAG: hypothetical protein U9Q83_10610, partial [Bacteroidota bacterium]|nr:hypothetical protein [Bacteroidota bacterium]